MNGAHAVADDAHLELLPYVPPSTSMASKYSSQGGHIPQPPNTATHPDTGGAVPSVLGESSGTKISPRERTNVAKLELSHDVWGWLYPV